MRPRISGVPAALVLVAVWLVPGVGSAAVASPPPSDLGVSVSAESASIPRGAAGTVVLGLTNVTSEPVTGICWSVDLATGGPKIAMLP